MERLFNLDFQLLHDAVLTAVSVFFLFMLLSCPAYAMTVQFMSTPRPSSTQLDILPAE